MKIPFRRLPLLVIPVVLSACGSSEPQHEVKPLTERPPVVNDFSKLKTKEEKIKFIQNSPAPDAEKAAAIAKVNAGSL